jgi:hypothetical protein
MVFVDGVGHKGEGYFSALEEASGVSFSHIRHNAANLRKVLQNGNSV